MRSHWGFSGFKYVWFGFFLTFKSTPLSKGCYALTDFWGKGPQAGGRGGRYPPPSPLPPKTQLLVLSCLLRVHKRAHKQSSHLLSVDPTSQILTQTFPCPVMCKTMVSTNLVPKALFSHEKRLWYFNNLSRPLSYPQLNIKDKKKFH